MTRQSMTRKPTPIADDRQFNVAGAAISGRTGRGKSGLYRFLWDNFERLEQERRGRPDWVGATAALTKLGVKDRNGEPLKPVNVRRVWERVVRDRQMFPPATPVSSPVRPEPATLLRPVSSTPPPSPQVTFEPPAEPEPFEFRTLGRPQRKKE
jgi:hypothetical protein